MVNDSLFSLFESNDFKTVFGNVQSGIVCFDTLGSLVYCNSFFTDIFGFNNNELDGFNIRNLSNTDLLDAVLLSLSGRNSFFEGYYISGLNGNRVAVKADISPIIIDNSVHGAIAIVNEITEMKNNERLFFHDVMNCTGNLKNLSELLNSDTMDTKTTKKLISMIYREADKVYNELTTYRHILNYNSNSGRTKNSLINSMTFLTKQIDELSSLDIYEDQLLRIAEDTMELDFSCDMVILDRVFFKLLKNATLNTTTEDTITVGFKYSDKHYKLWVNYTAELPEEARQFVFSKNEPDSYEKKGLGTYNVKFMIQRYLKGDVFFNSTPQEGTTFGILIPLS